MKVLFCQITNKYKGGAEKYLNKLTNELRQKGIVTSEFIIEENCKSKDQIFSKLTTKFRTISDSQFTEFLSKINSFCPNIIHLNTHIKLKNKHKKILKSINIPIILTVHNYFDTPFPITFKNSIKNKFNKFDSFVDYFIIPSKNYYETLVKKKIPNIYFIPHFIEEKKAKIEYEIQNKKHNKTILFIGRLEHQKGIILLLDTLKELLNVDSGYNLLIVGEGSLKSEIIQHIKSMQIEKYVNLVEYKSETELKAYFNKSKVLIVPSLKDELFGLIGLEAQAFGLPIIASDLPGIKEWCIHNQTGLSFKANNLSDLKKAIIKLMNDTELHKFLSINSHKYVNNHFSKETAMYKLINLYKEVSNED